jgi:hypothetical protein
MKILLVSIPSVHAIRWIENLKDAGHELYWFDILNRGSINVSIELTQILNWNKRKIIYIKGEHFLRKKIPRLYFKIQPLLEITVKEKMEDIILKIKPDVVHSFEMQGCSYPILNTMLKYPKLKWIYSCWGSDLYYYKDFKNHNIKIKQVLSRVNFLHTDCLRDYKIAKELGFNGEYLGVIPGGGGFKLSEFKNLKLPINDRNVILVKGYEHKFGRALNVLKALRMLTNELIEYKVVVFGAHQKIIDFINENELNFKVFNRDELLHNELITLMGGAKIYIGNSISDGMPNTLLEAVIMNAFPIQSNPGNVTSEIIENEMNGLLINNPDDITEIRAQIEKALQLDREGKFIESTRINNKIANNRLDYTINNTLILKMYYNIN